MTVQCLQNKAQSFQIKIRLTIKYVQVHTNKKINPFWMHWCHQGNNSIEFAISKLHLTAETAFAVSVSVSGNAHWLLTLRTVRCVFQWRERLILSAERNKHVCCGQQMYNMQHSWHRTSQPSNAQHSIVFISF